MSTAAVHWTATVMQAEILIAQANESDTTVKQKILIATQ